MTPNGSVNADVSTRLFGCLVSVVDGVSTNLVSFVAFPEFFNNAISIDCVISF
ncbi:hypothetical protein D3C76_1199090 [compost metagenome]